MKVFKITRLSYKIDNAPKLHYLDVFILDNNNWEVASTKALIDTGCAKTAISSQFYDYINKINLIPIVSKPSVNIQTCDGTTHPVAGTVDINLAIGKSKEILLTINALVVPNLADNLLIGLDILANNIIYKITPKSIFVKLNNKIIEEQFSKINHETMTIKASKMTIHPCQFETIKWKVPMAKDSFARCLKIMEGLMLMENPLINDNIFSVKIFNASNNNISLNCDDNILKICKMQFPLSIPMDDYMSLDEYDRSVEGFNKKGYLQPSITSYIEQKNNITELDKFEEPSFVTDKELLKQFDIGHLPIKAQKQFSSIVLKNRKAFSTHKWDIGVTNKIEMEIKVKTPELRIQKYIPIPLHTREKVKDILDQFLKIGIIRHCTEPSKYCSNILVVPKKDKDSIRLLFDGRLLNYDTERLPMASISKSEILSQLAGKDHLSSLDFADAFYHIPLSKEAQPLTAFYAHTHALRMCFTRAPQGLKNSPLYLKMLLDKIFSDMTSDVLFYADDLLIATTGTLKDHIKMVEKVIFRIKDAGLKVRPAKVLLARTSLEFLGMVFEKNTLNIPKMRLEAFRKLPNPTTPKKLKSIICALAYYRHFVPRFSELSRELMEMAGTKHPKQFKFEERHEKLLRDLIQAICDNAVTYFPDPKKDFYVQTDASMFCAGGRLYQKDDENNELLIAAVSRTFTKTERHYTIYKKEALALLYTLRAMDFFLKYAPKVILLVDSKALTYIRLAKESSGILLRFSLELSKYDADIIHVPGKENEISDLLSREHEDIKNIESEIASKQTISEKDTIKIIDALTIPTDFTLTKTQLYNLLNGPSPLDDTKKTKPKKNKIKEGVKNIKNIPDTLNKRNIKMPSTTKSRRRPGVILPTKVMTRSRAKKTVSFVEEPIVIPTDPIGAGQSGPMDSTDDQLGDSVEPSQNRNIPNQVEFERLDNSRRRIPHSKGTKEWRERRTTLANDNLTNNVGDVEVGSNDSIPENDHKQDTPNIASIHKNFEETYLQDSYETLKDVIDIINEGDFPVETFSRLQTRDEHIMKLIYEDNSIVLKDNIYYKKIEDKTLPLLPVSLGKMLINMHHHTFPGIHKSATRIERDIRHVYAIVSFDLKNMIQEEIEDCHICQIYAIDKKHGNYTNLPRFKSPRLSWSIDLITDLPESENKYKILMICVDDFSNYVIPAPIKTATANNLMDAIKTFIILPFGCPHFIRSDEQPGIYNSKEFYSFLTENNIQLQATAVASPFSNGRAESTIKLFKHSARKFFFQHKLIEKWDENVHFVSSAINQSVNTYNNTPEEIMFGYKIPHRAELVKWDNLDTDNHEIVNIIIEKASILRANYEKRKSKKESSNITFKNKLSTSQRFVVGDLVLHRQMQVSTGSSSKWKPLFTGPFVINEVDKSLRTAVCQNTTTGKTIKAHFNNLVKYSCKASPQISPAGVKQYKKMKK